MTPASEIVERCGGNLAVANWLGLERTAVQRWQYDPPRGLGNKIPMKHWAALIEAAARHGKVITLSELMPSDVAKVAKAEARRTPTKAGRAA